MVPHLAFAGLAKGRTAFFSVVLAGVEWLVSVSFYLSRVPFSCVWLERAGFHGGFFGMSPLVFSAGLLLHF